MKITLVPQEGKSVNQTLRNECMIWNIGIMEHPPLLKILSVVVRERIVEGTEENLFPFAKVVETFKPFLYGVVGGKEESLPLRN